MNYWCVVRHGRRYAEPVGGAAPRAHDQRVSGLRGLHTRKRVQHAGTAERGAGLMLRICWKCYHFTNRRGLFGLCYEPGRHLAGRPVTTSF